MNAAVSLTRTTLDLTLFDLNRCGIYLVTIDS